MSEAINVAVVNLDTALVENIVVIADGDGSKAAPGFQFVPSDQAAIGDSWDGTQIVKAPEPVAEIAVAGTLDAAAGDALVQGVATVEPDTTSARLAALEARMAAVEAKIGI